MKILAFVFVLMASACTTHFTGAATVPNGPNGCKAICSRWGMELGGMIAMGEYTNGCICTVPGKASHAASVAGAAGAAAVGVFLEGQQQQQQAQAQTRNQ